MSSGCWRRSCHLVLSSWSTISARTSQGRARGGRGARRNSALSAALFTRSEPDRAGHRQAQTAAASRRIPIAWQRCRSRYLQSANADPVTPQCESFEQSVAIGWVWPEADLLLIAAAPGSVGACRYWAAAAIGRAAAGRYARRNVRIWRTASGILSGVSFHGYRLTCAFGARCTVSMATA